MNPTPAPQDHAPWWSRDRAWTVPAAVTAVTFAAGTAVLASAGGLAGTLGAEAGFGLAAAFTVATTTSLRRAYRGRADDDATTYTDGIPFELVATGTVGRGPIAHLTRDNDTDPLAELRRENLTRGELTVDTITARLGHRRLRLEHRRGTPDDHPGAPVEEPPDLVVRWIDDQGRPVAGAHRTVGSAGARWSLPARAITLHLDVPADPDRRPNRRTLYDRAERAFLLTHHTRRRLPVAHVAAPRELDPAEVLLCLWLSHLLRAHAAAHEPWSAPGADWTLVPDDFPHFVGPGGFGRTYSLPNAGTPSPGGS